MAALVAYTQPFRAVYALLLPQLFDHIEDGIEPPVVGQLIKAVEAQQLSQGLKDYPPWFSDASRHSINVTKSLGDTDTYCVPVVSQYISGGRIHAYAQRIDNFFYTDKPPGPLNTLLSMICTSDQTGHATFRIDAAINSQWKYNEFIGDLVQTLRTNHMWDDLLIYLIIRDFHLPGDFKLYLWAVEAPDCDMYHIAMLCDVLEEELCIDAALNRVHRSGNTQLCSYVNIFPPPGAYTLVIVPGGLIHQRRMTSNDYQEFREGAMFILNTGMSEWNYEIIMALCIRLVRRIYTTRTKDRQLWSAYKHIIVPIVAIDKWGFQATVDLGVEQLRYLVAAALRLLTQRNIYN
jgi:hypothetical protein